MNINKKYIIIFGTLILLLVFITGAITYYNEKKGQAQIPDAKQFVLSFSRDYPVDFGEFSDFISFCKDEVYSNTEELKNKNEEIKETVCVLVRVRGDSSNTPIFTSLDSIISFKSGKYTAISVGLKNVIRKYDPSLLPALLEEEKLYFCSISKPSWADLFYLQMEPKFDLIFDDGDVSCGGITMDKTPSINFSGFIPKADSLSIKQYLVDEQTVSNVMNKQSFSEAKEILKDYPVIWQMEKPITP